jgi:hypothetical protein
MQSIHAIACTIRDRQLSIDHIKWTSDFVSKTTESLHGRLQTRIAYVVICSTRFTEETDP